MKHASLQTAGSAGQNTFLWITGPSFSFRRITISLGRSSSYLVLPACERCRKKPRFAVHISHGSIVYIVDWSHYRGFHLQRPAQFSGRPNRQHSALLLFPFSCSKQVQSGGAHLQRQPPTFSNCFLKLGPIKST